MDQSIFASYGIHAMNYFASLGFLCVRYASCRGNKITFSTILDLFDVFYLGILATETLSSTEASLNHREDGMMREMMGRGKRGSEALPPTFSLFPIIPLMLAIFIGIPSSSLSGGESYRDTGPRFYHW